MNDKSCNFGRDMNDRSYARLGPATEKPRVLFVSRERFLLPLNPTQRRKWDAIGERLDFRVLAAAEAGSPCLAARFALSHPVHPMFLDGAVYYVRLPRRIARELKSFQPDVAWVQGVHEGLAFLIARKLARAETKFVLDIQGDWRAATRLYGSRARRLLNPLNDLIGRTAPRRADGVRTLSTYTSDLVREIGVEPIAEFVPFVDSTAFLSTPPTPLPARPTALFVGVLERYKGFDTLAAAWPIVRASVPDAVLNVVGRGTLASLAQEVTAEGGSWTESLDAVGVAEAMDAATLLCLPSRSEGLGRVVVEAMCRGRAVVGGDAGGIPDAVESGLNALLVPPDDPNRLASTLVRVLGDRAEAERLGVSARRTAERANVTPRLFAAAVTSVIDAVRDEAPATTGAAAPVPQDTPELA
jgi:glycosyltransferase involved in cell wall biosynthesis